jgi:glycosyltransferase involved in cell wall biosynthesis
MRIAVNSRLLVPGKMDGIARFTVESFDLICKQHPEIDFTFIYDRKPPALTFGKNCREVSIPPPARHPILWYLWFEHSLGRYLNREKFDLFISPEGWVPPNLKCKSLAVIHDLNFFHHPELLIRSHRNFLLHYFPKYAKRADRIATVSEYSKMDIQRTLKVDESQIDVVYNGVSSSFKAFENSDFEAIKAKYSEGKDYFVFLGTIHPRKNLKNLLLAFERFKTINGGDEKLLVIGNRKWWPNDLENAYRSMSHSQDVVFTSRLEDQEVSRILSASIALTYLPFFEGFGIPILEAFKCKTAVITANNTSLPEVGGDAALYADANDIETIADQMKQLRQNTAMREKLIKKGSKQIEKFSWERTADLLWKSALKCLDHEP